MLFITIFLVTNDVSLYKELLPEMIKNYEAWEKENLDSNGLFWQIDDRMEWKCLYAEVVTGLL